MRYEKVPGKTGHFLGVKVGLVKKTFNSVDAA
jgi:hypothetical protein